MVKSYGVVAHVILVSALGPNTSYFLFGETFIQLGTWAWTRTWTRAWQFLIVQELFIDVYTWY